jgi:hypothetical protein
LEVICSLEYNFAAALSLDSIFRNWNDLVIDLKAVEQPKKSE